MNKETVALSKDQFEEIIRTIRSGFPGQRPNERVAAALVLEANLGIRISDIMRLRLSDVVRDGNRYRLDIREKKTKKKRVFTVPDAIMAYLQNYCLENSISKDQKIFPITERQVQRILQRTAFYLDMDRIGTHSFRKMFATQIYQNNNYNIILVQQLLQHSSAAITQRYIGIGSQELESALQSNLNLL